ncbi:MAG: aminotransferase class IV [Peptococcaceae bacterium]|nr:aminotransferase class IV [Peptococcaceae bacterium]
MPELVYWNGRQLDPRTASISINDRGFLFGDGVYEVIRSYNGKLFSLEEHLRRLELSMAALDLARPETDLAGLIRELFAKSGLSDAKVYLQITRGSEPRNHLFSLDLEPNLYINVSPAPAAAGELGRVSAVTVPDLRWHMCNVKSTSLVANIMAKHRARQAGAQDAVFVRDGVVTEAASSNVFLVEDGCLFTHPADNHVLAGVTRKHVLALAREAGIPVREEKVGRERLNAATEVFLSDTVHDVHPVVRIDGQPVGGGTPGPVAVRLAAAFRELTS